MRIGPLSGHGGRCEVLRETKVEQAGGRDRAPGPLRLYLECLRMTGRA